MFMDISQKDGKLSFSGFIDQLCIKKKYWLNPRLDFPRG
jgi:predicted CopG family antitoxin